MGYLQLYIYRWGNNSKRKTMQHRVCKIIARGKMNSCLVEFMDDGQREVISRNAIRIIKMKDIGDDRTIRNLNYKTRADGEQWKVDAIKNIREWFKLNLPDIDVIG